jgi:hypothetical protein
MHRPAKQKLSPHLLRRGLQSKSCLPTYYAQACTRKSCLHTYYAQACTSKSCLLTYYAQACKAEAVPQLTTHRPAKQKLSPNLLRTGLQSRSWSYPQPRTSLNKQNFSPTKCAQVWVPKTSRELSVQISARPKCHQLTHSAGPQAHSMSSPQACMTAQTCTVWHSCCKESIRASQITSIITDVV